MNGIFYGMFPQKENTINRKKKCSEKEKQGGKNAAGAGAPGAPGADDATRKHAADHLLAAYRDNNHNRMTNIIYTIHYV